MAQKTIIVTIVVLGLLSVSVSFGGQPLKTTRLPDPLIENLHYLLSFVGSEAAPPEQFQPQEIEKIIDFLAKPLKKDRLYHAGEYNDSPSAYYVRDIHQSLSDILRIAYNTDIHPVITAPSTIRTSHWTRIDRPDGKMPQLWELFENLRSPVFISGVEYMVNSPDTHSGAYYEYDLDRTLILMRWRGENIFVSLSKQVDVSSVGKKGHVIGSDSQWDYLYTDEAGLTKPGIGWARSYMYDSYSVVIYRELRTEPPRVRFAVFKWVRAGWANINLVRSDHIYDGLLRFGDVFKEILEHPQVSKTEQLEQTCASIRGLSDTQLQAIIRAYLNRIETRCKTEGLLSARKVEEFFSEDQYLRSLDRQEMEAMVALEFVKQLLGKTRETQITYLPPFSDSID
jgi:hypothetical protein